MRRRTLVSVAGAVGALGLALWLANSAPSEFEELAYAPRAAVERTTDTKASTTADAGLPEVPYDERVFRITQSTRKLTRDEIEDRMAASDEVVSGLHAEAVDDVGEEVRSRMAAVAVSDEDRRAFYELNQDLFGGRPYEKSWEAIDQLLRIHAVREELGINDAANGLTYSK